MEWGNPKEQSKEPVKEQKEAFSEEKLFTMLRDTEQRRYLKILVTGMPKTGKTRFSLSAPDPMVYIDSENGVNPFRDMVADKEINYCSAYRDNPETKQLDSIRSLAVIDDAIYQSRNHIKPKTLVLDSMTSHWQWLQDFLRFEVVNKKGEFTKSGKPTVMHTGSIRGVPSDRRDWALATARSLSTVMALMSADSHVILTAQSHYQYDAVGNVLQTTKPTCNKNLPFLIDVVIELKKRGSLGKGYEYYGVIKECRHPVEGIQNKEIENPTFDKIFDMVFKKKSE